MKCELDGKYKVKTTTNYQGPLEKKSDGETEIRDGQTHRTDKAGCVWTSCFEVIDGKTVRMTSTADPREASLDFALTRPDGTPTREPVTYESDLKLACKDGKVQISGSIEYGSEIVFITMRKIDD